MEEKDFSLRLARLREKKGVSARDMSLSIGQNPGYINNIETGKSMPSLTGIFYICEYLGVSRDTIFKWIETKNMPAQKVGRQWKFKIDEVDAWIKSGASAE